MPQVSIPSDRKAEIARRVRLVRAVFASTQVEFCHRLGVSTQTWSHYEAGRMPNDAVLDKLHQLHGITSDYLRIGSFVGMPPETQQRLMAATVPERRVNKRRATAKISAE